MRRRVLEIIFRLLYKSGKCVQTVAHRSLRSGCSENRTCNFEQLVLTVTFVIDHVHCNTGNCNLQRLPCQDDLDVLSH
jgi:hypothetical protein